MAEHIISPPESPAEHVRRIAQLLYPAILLLAFIVFGALHSVHSALQKEDVIVPTVTGPGGKPLPVTKRRRRTGNELPEPNKFSPATRLLFQTCNILATLTYFAAGGAIAARALINRSAEGEHGWWCGEAKTVFIIGSAGLYIYVSMTLFDWTSSPNPVHLLLWSLGLCGEALIFVCDMMVLSGPHKVMTNLNRDKYVIVYGMNGWDVIDLSLAAARIALYLGMVVVYVTVHFLKRREEERQKYEHGYGSEADERTPLIRAPASGGYSTGHSDVHQHTNGHANGNVLGTSHGSGNTAAEGTHQMVDEDAGFYRPEKLPHTTWFEYLRGYSVFFPYMWPSKETRLQVIVVVCFVLLALQRWVNIMVPFQIGIVTNKLSGDDLEHGERLTMPWGSLGLLIMYKLLQGQSGLLGSFRSLLWIPVSQHTYRALTTSAFEHVHSLSLDFHLGKRTGEVLSALNKGSSVNAFLEQVTFQVFPMLVDLFVAISYFYVRFDATYAVIVSAVTFYYLVLTVRMASKTADQRREMSNADREEEAVKNDSIISYETVKYFNAEDFEFNRYRQAINNFQTAEAKVTWSISLMNIFQSVTFMIGMLVAMMLGAYQVTQGQRKVGDFVTLMTYLGQLQGPLNFFGTFYRTVQQAMISGERLLELFKQRPSVVDRPGAAKVESCEGHVEFSKVKFAYDKRKPALRNLTFTCEPGTTTALVGESGGGKSTMFRLMYRYFNPQLGSIRVDGRDVKDISIDSLRRFIGVVPQDTILFNDTLMYNLKYANQEASDDDVIAACQAASIHDRIMTFPDGYHTKVGERGLRLSGGEKQRVAIARTLLKNPKIIMLDEATSALDTHTEQQIQSRLSTIGRGRTMLIIAHRLSTITHADQILVLNQGTIIERGTHEKLLQLNGRYASMWNKQAKAEKAAEDARVALQKANKMMRKANILTASGEYHDHQPSTGGNDDSSSSSDESTAPLRPGNNQHENIPPEASQHPR
ncbi:hypothetical protein F4778DRAFT_725128 [Xylariomycetidae sp. FL2044]|nr:hypothetical protein F4778DRAFT_725128 [Xylariomycetidae sp. FL2044]